MTGLCWAINKYSNSERFTLAMMLLLMERRILKSQSANSQMLGGGDDFRLKTGMNE
jgi:hypothetical protein